MLLLSLDPNSPFPLKTQIARGVIEAVEAGRLRPGDSLPSTRRLAEQLGVSRFTVEAAYEELWAEGYTEARSGSYTRVRAKLRQDARPCLEFDAPPTRFEEGLGPALRESLAGMEALLGGGNQGYPGSTVPRRRSEAATASESIDFARFTLDPRLYPIRAFRKSLEAVLTRDPAAALVYAPPEGEPRIRGLIARRMCEHGVTVGPENIVMSDGSLHGLDLVARLLAAPGATVLCEAPTFSGAILLFRLHGLRIIGLERDREGLRPEALAEALAAEAAAGRQPAFLYLIPSLHNPTGSLMGQARREAVLDIASRANLPIIEDCFEEEVSSYGNPVKPISAMDRRGLVFYLGTYSKILFPGIRLGWIAAQPRWAERLALLRAVTGVSGNALVQAAVAEFMESGAYDSHVRRINRLLARRLRSALGALRSGLAPTAAELVDPAGGYLLWLRLTAPEDADPGAVEGIAREAARGEGLLVQPGSPFWPDKVAAPHLRLSIAGLNEEEIEEGVRRLVRSLASLPALTRASKNSA